MPLYEDFLPYRDKDGMTGLDTDGVKGFTTQNGTLFTMQYLFCLLQDHDIPQEIKLQEIDRIRLIFKELEKSFGLSSRASDSTEFDSMDNTVAWLTFSALFDQGRYANRMYMFGQNNYATGVDQTQDADKNNKYYPMAKWFNILSFGRVKNFWNNQHPDQFCFQGWFGRSPAMLGLLRMTSGRWCNPFLWISVMVGQFLGCTDVPQNTDARTLSYVMWQYLKTRSFIWKIAYKIWCWQLLRVYPNGMQSVYSIYYKKTHPICKYSTKY